MTDKKNKEQADDIILGKDRNKESDTSTNGDENDADFIDKVKNDESHPIDPALLGKQKENPHDGNIGKNNAGGTE